MPAPHFGQDTLAPQTMCPASVLAAGRRPSVESGSRCAPLCGARAAAGNRHYPAVPWLSADGKKLLITRALRTFAYGYLAVVLAVYLDRLGLPAEQIGFLLTAAIAGSALMTIFWSLLADRYGRRRTIATMALLMAFGGLVFAFAEDFLVLFLATLTGTISATSSEVGVFQTVEQAILPQTAPNDQP